LFIGDAPAAARAMTAALRILRVAAATAPILFGRVLAASRQIRAASGRSSGVFMWHRRLPPILRWIDRNSSFSALSTSGMSRFWQGEKKEAKSKTAIHTPSAVCYKKAFVVNEKLSIWESPAPGPAGGLYSRR